MTLEVEAARAAGPQRAGSRSRPNSAHAQRSLRRMPFTTALVAGASGDVGQAITNELAQLGAKVFALGRNRQRLQQIAEEVPGRIFSLAADLTSKADIAVVRDKIAHAGQLDLLVMASGIYERSRDADGLARQFAANVQGPSMLLAALLPQLIKSRGLVVFINSSQGLRASREVGHYAATQHAMRAVADSLRDEINAKGVRVTSLFLGRTATKRQRAIFETEGRRYYPEKLIQPADVADLVASVAMLNRTTRDHRYHAAAKRQELLTGSAGQWARAASPDC